MLCVPENRAIKFGVPAPPISSRAEAAVAWVELPDYFQALNGDYRYQLTAIGAPGPNLYIAKEISGNRFKISGGKSSGKVSWQVTGIRQDAYANAHRIAVEEDKPAEVRGRYLHPELFGAPREQAIGVVDGGLVQPVLNSHNGGNTVGPTTAEKHD